MKSLSNMDPSLQTKPPYVCCFVGPLSFSNPTSPLGDRWFRACVSAFIPSTPTILYTVLEEGFSPRLKTVVPNAGVATYINFFRHPGHHHFFIIFPTPVHIGFNQMLAPNLEQASLKNRSQERLGKLATFTLIFNGF